MKLILDSWQGRDGRWWAAARRRWRFKSHYACAYDRDNAKTLALAKATTYYRPYHWNWEIEIVEVEK